MIDFTRRYRRPPISAPSRAGLSYAQGGAGVTAGARGALGVTHGTLRSPSRLRRAELTPSYCVALCRAAWC